MTMIMTDIDLHLPAEWESDGAILLAWPHEKTDWNYMLDDATDCFRRIVEAITPYYKVVILAPDVSVPQNMLAHLPSDRVLYLTTQTNDTWARDFGPITLLGRSDSCKVCDFRFNGWGLKFASDRDNLITSHMKHSGLITADVVCCQNFVLEGGGIESNGAGSLMTTAHCQLSPNRNPWMSETEIQDYLMNIFGARQVIWLRHGYLAGDDTDSHIDTLARFASPDTIIYVECDDMSDEHYEELAAMKAELASARTLSGDPYNLVGLPLPDPVYDEDGHRLPATYANFLITPKAVFVPVYGQPQKDLLATQIMQVVFDRDIVPVNCSALIRQHGSLHCVTMQLPKQILAV